jgi:hypothetical protein
MKYTRSFVNGLVACGIALAMVSTSSAQSKEAGATVLRIKGTARYTLGNNIWQPLSTGQVLHPGSVVQTSRDAGSYVDLALGEGSITSIGANPIFGANPITANAPGKGGTMNFKPSTVQNTVRVMENTVLGIDKLNVMETGADVVSDTQLDLKSGRIVGNVKKMSAASRYEIKLPNGVAGIRGTVYDITADGTIRVASGSVVISFVDSKGNVQTRSVMGGQEYNSQTDQITALQPGIATQIETAASATGAGAIITSSSVSVDRTIYFISPTTGNTGGNNGGE